MSLRAWWAALLLTCSCGGPGDDGTHAQPDLAPRLLDDRSEIQGYLAEFPIQQYEIHVVAGVGSFYLDDNPANVKSAIRRGQQWEPHLVQQFEKYVRPGATVLDIGAHIGSLTVPLARLVGPKGHVYAFEPQRKVYRELVHNLRLNQLSQAIPLRYAASDAPSVLEMNPLHQFDGRTSIGEGGDRVEARSIDGFGFRDVSLIKIDVEGHETAVLAGAERTIHASHPVILIEIWEGRAEQITAQLREVGYSLRKIGYQDYLAIFDE